MGNGRAAVAVGVGAAAGASIRWGVGELVDGSADWPWATFAVNVLGAFFLGIVLATTNRRIGDPVPDPVRLALGVGFCGALTTFSTFAVEIAAFGRDDRVGTGAGYLVVSLVVGLAAFTTGRTMMTRRTTS